MPDSQGTSRGVGPGLNSSTGRYPEWVKESRVLGRPQSNGGSNVPRSEVDYGLSKKSASIVTTSHMRSSSLCKAPGLRNNPLTVPGAPWARLHR